MPTEEIEEIKQALVDQLLPIRIYLFGSYATGTYTDESDLDFYIIVSDNVSDIPAETAKAYISVRQIKRHPVDIVAGRESRFHERKDRPTFENEVYSKGVLLYDAGCGGADRSGRHRFGHRKTTAGRLLPEAAGEHLLPPPTVRGEKYQSPDPFLWRGSRCAKTS